MFAVDVVPQSLTLPEINKMAGFQVVGAECMYM